MRYLLQHGLEAAADAHPDRTAVFDRGRHVAYGELEARANQLARLLVERNVSRGDRVGIYLEKSFDSVVGIYGTLKAGAVYVPLDPDAPVSRLAYIARNCGMRVLLTAAEKVRACGELVAGGAPLEHVVVLDSERIETDLPRPVETVGSGELNEQPSDRPRCRTIGLDLAYILHTSGSTGTPKGVMLSHLNGLAFVDWAVEEFAVGPDDRLSSHAPFHFDLSIFDLFAASSAGAAVVLVPPEASLFPIELGRFIERNAISVWYSVPSILNMLVERGGLAENQFPALRVLLFAGEVFPSKYLSRLMKLLPRVRFCNLYGPTETNVCAWYEVPAAPPEQSDPIPIGRAIPSVEIFALDDDGRRVHGDEVGELHVRGPTVMQGYWGDPDETARSLVTHPMRDLGKDLAHRTGDLVRETGDGDFVLLGRRDHRVKSRGHRIELGDVESALYACPAVVECAVTAVPDELVSNKIEAHVVVDGDVTASQLADFCAARLPRHMVPESIDIMTALPRTSTGKIDRRALLERALTGKRPRR
ncbi:MAG TPA: amino acid adenylation domain-containing protein [Actinomycetota bacterium]|nr:amino acid adenylation domain-containing protein [Actinomycetota bacterium]